MKAIERKSSEVSVAVFSTRVSIFPIYRIYKIYLPDFFLSRQETDANKKTIMCAFKWILSLPTPRLLWLWMLLDFFYFCIKTLDKNLSLVKWAKHNLLEKTKVSFLSWVYRFLISDLARRAMSPGLNYF